LSKETKLPAIPHSSDPATKALKEALEVRLGRRGDPLDRGLTIRDLYNTGVISVRGMPTLTASSANLFQPVTVIQDTTPPTAPTTVTVNGAFVGVLVSWDSPARKDLTAHIYRNTVDDRATAVLTGTSAGAIYSDLVGHGQTYYYWVRYVSVAEVTGPYNAVAGTQGVTAVSISNIISDLDDAIDISALANAAASEAPFLTVEDDGLTTGFDGTLYLDTTQAWQQANHPTGKWFAPGVYIRSALIADASIDVAKIHNLTVDFAQVTGTLTAAQVAAITVTADMIAGGLITADMINMNGNIKFNNSESGIQFGKTSLGDGQAGAFFGRGGGVAGFNISSATSGIYADSSGVVSLSNVTLYSGDPGDPVEYPNVGTFTANINDQTTAIFVVVIGGGGGSCNGAAGNLPSQYRNAGGNGGNSTIQWYSGANGTGTLLGTYTGYGGAGLSVNNVSANNDYYNGANGQASSKAPGGLGGIAGWSGASHSHGSFGSGGGGPAGSPYLGNAAVITPAPAGTTFSQSITKPSGAHSIKITVGVGGLGGAGTQTITQGQEDNISGYSTAAGGNGGNGFVSYTDPSGGGAEIDLPDILARLTALEGFH
jgi:hypothetical protein